MLYVYYMVEMNFFYCLVCHHLLAKTGGSLEERNRMSCVVESTTVVASCQQKAAFFVRMSLKKLFVSVLTCNTLRQEHYEFASGRKEAEDKNITVTDITDGVLSSNDRSLAAENTTRQ